LKFSYIIENIILTTEKNTKPFKYMCGFGPSKECLFYSRKICYTLVLELFLSLKNLEEN